MARRIKTKNAKGKKTKTAESAKKVGQFWKDMPKNPAGVKLKKEELRFGISLVILIALLSVSAYLLIFALGSRQKPAVPLSVDSSASRGAVLSGNAKTKLAPGSLKLDDASLDFGLKIPAQFGEWLYKIGYVKSPTDETLSNQYVKIYVPSIRTVKSNSFEDKYQEILTIRKFSDGEWQELEKGCTKGNQFYCEETGTKITDMDGSVWAYTVAKNCPRELEPKCKSVETVAKSFQLK